MDTQPGIKNPSQGKHETYEIKTKSKPQRALGGKGLLSHSISVQSLKNPYLESYPREEKGRKRGRKRGAPEGRRRAALIARKREREREKGGEGVFNPNNSHPKRLLYP